MNLNIVLYGLTHIGPEGFPMTRAQLMDILANFGLRQEKHRKAAIEMLQLAGHIEYVIDKKRGRGFYRLARSHLRPRPDGDLILAGARSPDMLSMVSANTESGTSWRIGEDTIEQPDIAVIKRGILNEIAEPIVSALINGNSPDLEEGWTLPSGDLPTWEATVMGNVDDINEHPTVHYSDDTCKIFNPDNLMWDLVIDRAYVFEYTGPLFLIRRRTYTGKQHVILIKNRTGTFTECVLPPGLDHLRWARLLLLASYGVETIRGIESEILETRIKAQLPICLASTLVDITGRVPTREGELIRFHGVKKDVADQVILACTETFTSTTIYNQTKGDIT